MPFVPTKLFHLLFFLLATKNNGLILHNWYQGFYDGSGEWLARGRGSGRLLTDMES